MTRGAISSRKDKEHRAQLNVAFRNTFSPLNVTTIWATSHEEGLRQLREEGLLLEADGPNDAILIPWHEIRGVKLMGTADPKAVEAAQDAYDEECPRC